MPDTPARSARRPVDERALARGRARVRQAPGAPWLHGEVARRLAERLAVVRLQPQRVLDWGLATRSGGAGGARGHDAAQSPLAAAYPRAEILRVDEAPAAVPPSATAVGAVRPAPWWARLLGPARGAPVLAPGAVPAGQAQLVWSNMWLHHCADPQAEMHRWQRALQVDGFLMFSTLGPGSLQGLRTLYATQGWPPPHAPFVDMHDLGDMLVEAGFADPVMDQETLTLTWADAGALLAELRGLGVNSDLQRGAGLRTPRWRSALVAALDGRAGSDGRIALEFEIVYGHAFRAAPRAPVRSETSVGLEDMRAMIRGSRGKP